MRNTTCVTQGDAYKDHCEKFKAEVDGNVRFY